MRKDQVADVSGYHPCTCIALDVQAYGSNTDRRQSDIQHDLPRILAQAAHGAGLDRSGWRIQAKGDEELAVAPLDGTEPRIVDDYIRRIVSELRAYNRIRVRESHIRVRAAVHHGPVEIADNGFAGRAVVTTCRLLNSAPVRTALNSAERADLVLVLSDEVYRGTVAGGHTTFDKDTFRKISVTGKELRTDAWLWVPRHDVHRLDLGPGTGPDGGPGGGADGGAGPGRDGGPDQAARHGAPRSGPGGEGAPVPPPSAVSARQVNVNNVTASAVDLRGSVLGFGSSHV